MYGTFAYIWLICMVNVGKYTSPMDGMGLDSSKISTKDQWMPYQFGWENPFVGRLQMLTSKKSGEKHLVDIYTCPLKIDYMSIANASEPTTDFQWIIHYTLED